MKKLNSLLSNNLTRSVQSLDNLSSAVYEIMNLDQKDHNLWAVAGQQQLTLVTDHPILANQLQFRKDEICNQLNRRFLLQFKSAQVKIAPPKMMYKIKKEKRFTITERASEVLKCIAEQIDDNDLKESLINLTKGKH